MLQYRKHRPVHGTGDSPRDRDKESDKEDESKARGHQVSALRILFVVRPDVVFSSLFSDLFHRGQYAVHVYLSRLILDGSKVWA
jgi:hypothetical protein